MTTWSAVTWATIGVMSTRLKRSVTWSWSLPVAGLTALHPPASAAEYSPPGALGGGLVSAAPAGAGSVTYSHAALCGGVDVLMGACGHGRVAGTPSICADTAPSTSVLVGSWLE